MDLNGGNVNLLWIPEIKEARVIDHNIAFDSSFSTDKLKGKHVFRDVLNDWEDSLSLEFEPFMLDILKKSADYFAELPPEWIDSANLLKDFSFERINAVLNRFQSGKALFQDITL